MAARIRRMYKNGRAASAVSRSSKVINTAADPADSRSTIAYLGTR
jgi:hypothetical protein